MPISTCTVSGNIKDLLNQNVSGVTIKVYAIKPFFHTSNLISGQIAETTSDSSGAFSLDLIETETVGYKLTWVFEYSNGASGKSRINFAVVIPDTATANFASLVAAQTVPAALTSFPATSISVLPVGNLTSTDAQAALAELQGDIDTINSLADGKIYIGNSLNTVSEVTPSGDIVISNLGVTSISAGVVVDADINASAAITLSKLAPVTASRALQSDSSGVISASSVNITELSYLSGVTSALQTQLDSKLTSTLSSARIFVGNASNVATGVAVTGDIGVDNAGLTSISAGVIVDADVNASAAIAYSKLNLSGSILNADINASAGIVDTKLATISTAGKVSNSATTAASANTASAIVARDGSGNFTAGTITAALTGTASGNTAYTANNHGVVISGSGNTMSVIAPDASATKVLKSGGASADPTWLAYTDANTVSTLVARDSGGNFSAGTVTAALTGTASGNTSYTANNHGVVISGSANTMTVIAPDASTTKALISGGSSANPAWGTLAIGGGGTGQVTKAAAFDALSPMSASGDVIYGGTAGTGTRLAKGSDGQVLTLASGLPTWAAATATSIIAKYKTTGTGTASTTAPINFDTSVIDTNTAVTTGAAWKFTAPSTGYYLVTANAAFSAGTPGVFIYKNGTQVEKLFDLASNSSVLSGTTIISLSATDYVDIRPGSSQTWISGLQISIAAV